jgi:hypothetical protein
VRVREESVLIGPEFLSIPDQIGPELPKESTMATWEHNIRLSVEIENLDEVRTQLEQLGIPESELVDTLLGLTYMGEFDDLYVFQTDASDPEDGYVVAPEFHLGKWDDGPEEAQVGGPIKWSGKYYQI